MYLYNTYDNLFIYIIHCNKSTTEYWACSSRPPGNRCPATVVERHDCILGLFIPASWKPMSSNCCRKGWRLHTEFQYAHPRSKSQCTGQSTNPLPNTDASKKRHLYFRVAHHTRHCLQKTTRDTTHRFTLRF